MRSLHVSIALCGALTASGCDRPAPQLSPAEKITPEGAPALDIAAMPQLLFRVVGTGADIRLVPMAAVVKHTLRPIGLTQRGWRLLDSLYLKPGTRYPVYREGNEDGEVAVTRGMWTDGMDPPVAIAGCIALKPIATAILANKGAFDAGYVEVFASSLPLATRAPFTGTLLTEAEISKLGRDFGHAVGKAAGIEASALDSLDFHARLLVTGATTEPTLLVSFIDPTAGNPGPGAAHTTHLFALGEKSGGEYRPVYRHVVRGNAKEVEFQRIVDHLDVGGAGVDDLIMEAWRYGADNDAVVLSFRGGEWRETMRTKQGWCLDAIRAKK